MKLDKKTVLSLALVFCLAIGGTFAYLFATDKKDNVFTTGNLTVKLHESDWWTSDENDMNMLVDDAKVINNSLTGVYADVAAKGTTVEDVFVPTYEITMFNASDQEVNDISDASYFTAVNDNENITYRAAEGGKTVESNGINDFAEGIIAGQEIHCAPYIENEGGASCWAYIAFKTPTLSVEESYLNENGQIMVTGEQYKIEVTGYAIQKGYGHINDKDPKYDNNVELLLNDIWASVAAASLPTQRTMNDRVNFISLIDADNDDWVQLQMFQGSDGYNYYVYGYKQVLSGRTNTSAPIESFMVSGYQIKAFTCPTAPTSAPPNNTLAKVSYTWIQSYGYNTQQKNTDGTTKDVVLSAGAVLHPEYNTANGCWNFYIQLADGNIIYTDYKASLAQNVDLWDAGEGSSVITFQTEVNSALRNESSVIAYAVPAIGAGLKQVTSYPRWNTATYVGIPVLALTNGSTPSSNNLNYYTQNMPLNAIKVKQSDGTYKSYKLTIPYSSETQVKINSTGAVFYNGSYASWIEACINTGMLLGNFTYLV